MKTILALAVVATLSGGAAWAETVKGEWTGYITDTHCGDKGATKDHTKGCVEKCMKAGSKAQIKNDADGKIYDLSSFDQVKPLMGQKVTVSGSLDKDTNTITVTGAVAAK